MKDKLRYIEDRIRRCDICLIRVPEGKRDGEWGQSHYTEAIVEERKAENFPNLQLVVPFCLTIPSSIHLSPLL